MRGIEEYTNITGASSTIGADTLEAEEAVEVCVCGRDDARRSSREDDDALPGVTGSMDDMLIDLRWRDPGLAGAPLIGRELEDEGSDDDDCWDSVPKSTLLRESLLVVLGLEAGTLKRTSFGVSGVFPAEPADRTRRVAASAESVRGDRGAVGFDGETDSGAGSVAATDA